MLELVTTGQFHKDYRRVKKRGYDMKLLEDVIHILQAEQPLAAQYRDPGRGHIRIYSRDGNEPGSGSLDFGGVVCRLHMSGTG